MNLILISQKDFIRSDRVVIRGRRYEHIQRVLKAKTGQNLSCGQINGKMGWGTIEFMDREKIEMMVCLDQEPPNKLPLILILALPRPKMLKRIITSVTTLGVQEIFLINSWRVDKSFWQSQSLRSEQLQTFVNLGLEQAGDTIPPLIHKRRIFTTFIKQELSEICYEKTALTAHPKTEIICPVGINNPTVLVVGPEGGFIEPEIKTLQEHGMKVVNLGARILRVETAVTWLVSRLFNAV